MDDSKDRWTAAEAKAAFSSVVDGAAAAPQVIERHGKPVGVVIGWEAYKRHAGALEGSMGAFLDELADINRREGDMDEVLREDSPLPEGL